MINSGPKEVVIFGAGALGAILYDCLAGDDRWVCTAFHDDGKAGQTLYGLPILGTGPDQLKAGQSVFMALGDPSVRRAVVERLRPRDLVWEIFVDRRSMVGPNAKIGEGSIVLCQAVIASSVVIDPFTWCGTGSQIGGGSTIGAFSSVLSGAFVTGSVIGEECILGLRSLCSTGARLGNRVTVGPATVLHRPIPEGAFVIGNPARVFARGAPGFASRTTRGLSAVPNEIPDE
ncbi:hypothetical protein [Amphritea sp.]|uniref:PglD-related sugar-binding protein n=1 Tax=Amphritea sp. TaxID=1872502 RepID=UPI003D0F6574